MKTMREILFRGKKVNDNTFVEGYYVYEPSCKKHQIYEIYTYSNGKCSTLLPQWVDEKTVGQFTGLTDKNSTKIFEGDIVRMNGNDKDLAVIKYGEFGCIDVELQSATDIVLGWYYEPLPTDALSKCLPFCLPFQISKDLIERTRLEVIGNIYDNPELLKDGDGE